MPNFISVKLRWKLEGIFLKIKLKNISLLIL